MGQGIWLDLKSTFSNVSLRWQGYGQERRQKQPLGEGDQRARELPVPYQSVSPSICPSVRPSYSQYVSACNSLLLQLVQGVTSTYVEVQMCDFCKKLETTSRKGFLTYISHSHISKGGCGTYPGRLLGYLFLMASTCQQRDSRSSKVKKNLKIKEIPHKVDTKPYVDPKCKDRL